MFKAIIEFFTGKKADAPVAPYKVEEVKVEAVNAQPVVTAQVAKPAEKPAKKQGAKKPAAAKAPAKSKGPKKPRAPKAKVAVK